MVTETVEESRISRGQLTAFSVQKCTYDHLPSQMLQIRLPHAKNLHLNHKDLLEPSVHDVMVIEKGLTSYPSVHSL